MADYWTIAQRHLAAQRDQRAADPVGGDPEPAPTPPADPTEGDIAAVRLTSPLIGDYWLVADDDDLTPDILAAGLPVFRFAEVPFLRGLAPADLQAVAAVKRAFPTSEVVQ